MSSATLASPRTHAHPDLVRITALSAAMTINFAVLVVALRPLPPMAIPHLAAPSLGVRLIDKPEPKPLPPPPPPINVRPLAHTTAAPILAPPVATTPIVTEEGRLAEPPIPLPTIVPPVAGTMPTTLPGPPIEATLAYRSAPLIFPRQAIRLHMHGTVLLRVLVDEQGKPMQVIVAQSSGHALLDRSARQQVLAGWRFQPAVVDGHAVRAWAQVPVNFELRQL
ncbi:energy transducer TonB [Frateuria hangzhouensis]|uniref:energy transducer TonB n=1 Tax=Frateuria hangzhouensis TaxID=2995589 RepID=UPI002260EACB|nr:energy transducer TonB [Frateuria sp. STR12]MCX7514621.1 TonB family protein [Frateuria sp. STR12]